MRVEKINRLGKAVSLRAQAATVQTSVEAATMDNVVEKHMGPDTRSLEQSVRIGIWNDLVEKSAEKLGITAQDIKVHNEGQGVVDEINEEQRVKLFLAALSPEMVELANDITSDMLYEGTDAAYSESAISQEYVEQEYVEQAPVEGLEEELVEDEECIEVEDMTGVEPGITTKKRRSTKVFSPSEIQDALKDDGDDEGGIANTGNTMDIMADDNGGILGVARNEEEGVSLSGFKVEVIDGGQRVILDVNQTFRDYDTAVGVVNNGTYMMVRDGELVSAKIVDGTPVIDDGEVELGHYSNGKWSR